jgi:hypothetical protein
LLAVGVLAIGVAPVCRCLVSTARVANHQMCGFPSITVAATTLAVTRPQG